jgi:hypothetical protein
MLVVDFMHECELGTWKNLFIHLIRLLYAIPRGTELVATLDSRYEFVRNAVTCLQVVASTLNLVLDFDKSRLSVMASFASFQTIRPR